MANLTVYKGTDKDMRCRGHQYAIGETEQTDDKDEYIPTCVKAEIVDGDRIKADTWYTLKNGEFVEV